ncbi:peptidoglycan-recognition protein SB2-like [Macrosteles quadrilineatus]|uniref:peptidoglycan-recognition protein SB2-like n=1 Tax=Macrosteles quadrilineatus TaxID=74068 RepID=UPI0023E0FECF|nr:peptidoglycan-recognition protein SB2-like [Macrosteles quadrilineatus]
MDKKFWRDKPRPRKVIDKVAISKRKERGWIKNIPLVPLVIVRRDEWGAKDPKVGTGEDVTSIRHPVKTIIISYTRHEMCDEQHECLRTVRQMQLDDMASGLPDIRYSFVVGGDGRVYEGRGYHYNPAKSECLPEFFTKALEIAHVGMHGKHLPQYMAKLAYDTVKRGVENGYVDEKWEMELDLYDAAAEGYMD